MDIIQPASMDNRNGKSTNSSTEADAKSLCLSLLVTVATVLVIAFGRNASATDFQQTGITEGGVFGSYLFIVLFEPRAQKSQVTVVGFGTFMVRQKTVTPGRNAILNETIRFEGNPISKSVEYKVSEDSSCPTGYAIFINDESSAPDGCVSVESRTELLILITPTIMDPPERPGMVPLPPPLSLFSVSRYLINKVTGEVVDTDYVMPGFKPGKALKEAVH